MTTLLQWMEELEQKKTEDPQHQPSAGRRSGLIISTSVKTMRPAAL